MSKLRHSGVQQSAKVTQLVMEFHSIQAQEKGREGSTPNAEWCDGCFVFFWIF